MAEEGESNKKKTNVTPTGSTTGWLVCSSQRCRPGKKYYFNKYTKEANWISDDESEEPQQQSASNVGNCPEPAEPPGDSQSSRQKVTQKAGGSRIYNEQIINNQFTKPYAIRPYTNPPCQCQSSSPKNDVQLAIAAPMYNPNIWTMPPPQVILAPAVPPLNNELQPVFNNINTPFQTTSVPLSSRFQIINQLTNTKSAHDRGVRKYGSKFPKCRSRNQPFTPRKIKNDLNNDLRNVLSAKRKNSRVEIGEADLHETIVDSRKDTNDVEQVTEIKEEDLYPSDIDNEWLEENKIIGETELKVDASALWRLAGDGAKQDCFFIIANTQVLLNNMKFLNSLIHTDNKVYLLTPLNVLKQLRSATGSSSAQLVNRARSAIRFVTRQMCKGPAVLKDFQDKTIDMCCLKLTQQNYFVVLVVDENEIQSLKTGDSVPTFTVDDLKKYLAQCSYTTDPESREDITVTITEEPSHDLNTECLKKDETISNQSAQNTPSVDEHVEFNSIESKEIQTEQDLSLVKQTVSVSVQTDFEFTPFVTSSLKTTNDAGSMDLDQASEDTTALCSAVETPGVESKAVPKKIRLKRNITSTNSEPVIKGQFKWRKRKPNTPTTNSTSKADVEPKERPFSLPEKSPPSSLSFNNDLTTQIFEGATDSGKCSDINDTPLVDHVNEKAIIEATSPAGVISKSADTDVVLNVNKNIVVNESTDKDKDDIVIFEVTGDLMNEYLSRGCDEWVSRFVQIIEEGLTQVLQQEPNFLNSLMPPPWNIQEATVCIRRKFEKNNKITSACDKLSNILLKISDNRGKISADLNPSDFMHMYSYGVYLINTLQLVLEDSEDLQIAAESLTRLLNDIKNPNADVSHNVFVDLLNTEDKLLHTVNNTIGVTDAEESVLSNAHETPERIQTPLSSKKSSPTTHSRKSPRLSDRGSIEEKKKEETQFIRKIDINESFFTDLKQKPFLSYSSEKHPVRTFLNVPHDVALPSSPPQQIESLSQGLPNGECPDTEITEKKTTEPKITRKFNRCVEFEEKFKKKTNEYLYFDNISDEEFDYSDGDYNYANGDAYDRETPDYYEEKYYKNSGFDYMNYDIIWNWVIGRVTHPIQSIIIKLHKFCNDTYKELKNKDIIELDYKTNLIEKIKKANIHIDNLWKHLNSILFRDDKKTKFQNVMEELGIDDFEIKDAHVAEYGATVQKFLSQVNLISESLNIIVSAVEQK